MQALCVYLKTEILAYQHVKTFLLKQESWFFFSLKILPEIGLFHTMSTISKDIL